MADPETPGWIASLTGLLGLAVTGFGGRHLWGMSKVQGSNTARIKSVEEDQKKHDETIVALKDQGTRTEITLSNFGEDLVELKGGIKKIVDHITKTNLG